MKRLLVVLSILGGLGTLVYVGRGYLARRQIPVSQASSGAVPAGTGEDSAAVDHAPTLIPGSPLLRRLGVRVYAVDNAEDAVKVPEGAVPRPGQSVFLLAKDDQLHELVPMPGEDFRVPWGCGGEAPAKGFKPSDGNRVEGRLAVIGRPDAKAAIRWSSASSYEVEKPPETLRYKPGYVPNSLFYANTVGLPQSVHVYTASWRSPAYSETPPSDGAGCADWTHEQLGLMTAQGEAKVLFDNPVDCDGQGYRGGTLGNLAGVLEVVVGAETETWLIFEASGYEGAAYLSLKLDLQKVEPQPRPDFVVYSGC